MITLSIDRTTIVSGPCFITWNGCTVYSKADVTIKPKKSLTDIDTSIAGKQTDRRLKNIFFVVGFEMDGEVTAALLAAFYLYAATYPNTSIFGAGLPLSIVSVTDSSDNYLTFANGAPTKLADLFMGTDKTALGAMEFTCIGGNALAVNNANRFYTFTTKVLSGAVTAATDAAPAVITSNGHGLANGDPISISGVVGNTAVNINGYAQGVTANTFEISTDLAGQSLVAGNAAYTSGGTWGYGWPIVPTNIVATPFVGQWATVIPSGAITGTSEASPDVVTTTAVHGLNVNDRVIIAGDTGDAAINGMWWVLTTPTTSTFTVSATRGGAAVAGAGTAGTGGTFTRANALDQFDTEKGVTISFNLGLTNKTTQNLGTYDIRFSSLTVNAKGLPISAYSGPTTRDILGALNVQGTSVQIGQSMAAEGQDLYLAGNGLYFRLYLAAIEDDEAVYSSEKVRPGDIMWTANRRFGAGSVLKPLYAISTTPINS
jgi:hypothetical protein